MLVNQNFMPGLNRSTPGIGAGFPEFPSLDFSIDTNPEFGDATIDGFGQKTDATNGRSFADFLTEAVDGVSAQDQKAVDTGLDFALGRKDVDAHQVMIEQAKAEAQLHLMSAVTNKVASSYQTLMNMQI
ncbi:flagellar hook-basal body complex protein FliE [bacterium]|nr:flagellar hook-basal body complex protein FliE [bacterium]